MEGRCGFTPESMLGMVAADALVVVEVREVVPHRHAPQS
jgi:hypothetical protein